MPRGGPRPNTGPKKGMKHKSTIEKEALRQVVYDFVAENMQPVLEGLLARAQGVTVVKKDEKGVQKAFSLPPDPQAARVLLENAIGKPKEMVEHSGEIKITELELDL